MLTALAALNPEVAVIHAQRADRRGNVPLRTVTVTLSDTTLAIDLDDSDIKVVRRTTCQPVRSSKGQRPDRALMCLDHLHRRPRLPMPSVSATAAAICSALSSSESKTLSAGIRGSNSRNLR